MQPVRGQLRLEPRSPDSVWCSAHPTGTPSPVCGRACPPLFRVAASWWRVPCGRRLMDRPADRWAFWRVGGRSRDSGLGLGLAGLGPCVFQEGRREAFGALRCGLAMQLCRCDQ